MSRTQEEQAETGLGTGFRTEHGNAGFMIRRAGVADLPALNDFFSGLSPRTRYLRFFAPVTPNPALLRLLCGDPELVDAVIAIRDGAIIGHAMAADAAPPPDVRVLDAARTCLAPPVKDIGIVVADVWQGQGVGAALMRALITAVQERGVTTLAMDVLEGNRKVLGMISAHWPATRVGHSRDCVTIHVRLPPPQLQRDDAGRHTRPSGRAGQPGRIRLMRYMLITGSSGFSRSSQLSIRPAPSAP
ncbi:MAG: GNAT family N-acetyltransferase [Streptosporangiaceae bacterium]